MLAGDNGDVVQDEAWAQDDAGARMALLAYLEGELPLEQAARKYASCFPPIAKLDAEQVMRSWSRWSAVRRQDMAKQIRRAMLAGDAGGDE